jgi:integrase
VVGALALFMFLTGARVSEALAVGWGDVNLNECTVLIRQTKVSSERVAHLPTRLVAALASLPRVNGRPVFVYRKRADLTRAWRTAIHAAGLKYLSTHCCRDGFATRLLRKGVDVVTVAELGGWKTPAQVLKTYGHAIKNVRLTDLLADGKLTHADASIAESRLKSGTT